MKNINEMNKEELKQLAKVLNMTQRGFGSSDSYIKASIELCARAQEFGMTAAELFSEEK